MHPYQKTLQLTAVNSCLFCLFSSAAAEITEPLPLEEIVVSGFRDSTVTRLDTSVTVLTRDDI